MVPQQNKFGILSNEYRMVRRGYPAEVYAYLQSLTKNPAVKVLDLGCGTGISTRELKQAGFNVCGLDKEEGMLAAARLDSPDISYVQGTAESIPFPDQSFDVVTAFTSFHWFQNMEALAEITRVLKPGGIFFVALKDSVSINGSKASWKEYERIIRKYAGPHWNSVEDYEPKKFLDKAKFDAVKELDFPLTEVYTIEESLTLLKSLSFWNLVPESQRENYLGEMRQFFTANSTDGRVERNRAIKTVVGYKPI